MIDDLDTGAPAGAAATIDTSIAADERANRDAAAPKAKASIAGAGAAYLAGLKPEQLAAPLGAIDDEDGDSAEEGTGAEVAAEAITRADGGTWKPELNRWVDATGKILAGAPPEGAPAAVAKPAAAAPVAKPAAAAAATVSAPAGSGAPTETLEKVTLSGIADRGEEDLELEIDDPVVAERLRRLQNEGLRGAAYREQRAALDAERQEFQEVTAAVEADPVGFVIKQMTPERQLAVARAVILEHFDTLLPELDALAADPAMRANKRVELRDQIALSEREAEQGRTVRAYAAKVMSAVTALIPEDASPADRQEFTAYARQHLGALAANGTPVTPENVKTHLARQLKFAGFTGQPAPAAAPAVPAARPAVPVAHPATPAARAIAARVPSAEDATAAAQRVRRVQTSRAAATRVAPAGAGAAPVSVPLLPPEAKTDIKTASKHLMRSGKLPSTWAGTT